ncbi:alpha/beta hydrolase family protein [Sphaerisporangium rufum]|nr:alpha/beta hydrolase [Sphaerisporangium rufum]
MPIRRAAVLAFVLPAVTVTVTVTAPPSSAAAVPAVSGPARGGLPHGPGGSAAAVDLRLPAPTGPYAVGRDVLHLLDTSRRDPWVPSARGRELMVSMYYPARRTDGGTPAPYLTVEEARLLLKSQGQEELLEPERLAATRTNARAGARAAGGRHPLVLASPGFSLNRATLSVLSEELASRGYVVALVDHAYESFGTTFPGGRTLTCVACDVIEAAPAQDEERKLLAKAATGRAADLSFVLDAVAGRRAPASDDGASDRRPAWKRWKMIDTRRVGAVGHSLGGNAAASVMAADRRVRAGVNLDGTFFAPVPPAGLGGRPFMMIGTAAGHSPGSTDTSWPRDWARLDGWKRWLTVRDTGHFSFIDIPVLGEQLGVTDPQAPLPGGRSADITRAYVGAFFDRSLRGKDAPLLAGPSTAYPEVTFQNP